MRAQEFIVEQNLNEGISNVIDRVLEKIFGPAGTPMEPGEFERKVGKIPTSPTTKQLQQAVAQYLDKANIEREAEELAWRNKTTVEKIKHYVIAIAAVVFSLIDPEKLGQALGDLIVAIVKTITDALLEKS